MSPEFGLSTQNVWLSRRSTMRSRMATIHFSLRPPSMKPPHSPMSSGAMFSLCRYSQFGSHTSRSSVDRSHVPWNHFCSKTSGP